MKFSPWFLNKLRDRVRLSEVIAQKIKLQRKGKEFLGLCPFHHEKTPSFSVNDEKKVYHCFGCGEGGDAIKFLQETSNFSFADAVESLAKQYGLDLPKEDFSKEQGLEEKIITINQKSMKWFCKNLYSNEASKALAYLNNRLIDNELIQKFHIGYAPPGRTELISHLKAAGYTLEEIGNAGLATKLDNGEFIDKFRDRIIFPILDRNRKVLGFGGRTMLDIQPKYLNSPETLVFKKKHLFYNENIVFKELHKLQTVYVVEGYTDVISLHRAGILNSAATLGTAISEYHIKKLWNVVKEPDICMDGDSAGIKAMERIAHVVLPMLTPGFSLNFITLPQGSDPDDVVKNSGSNHFQDLAASRISLCEALWRITLTKINANTPEKQALLRKDLMDITDKIEDSSVKSFYKTFFYGKLRELFNSFMVSKSSGKKNALASKEHINKIDDLPIMQRYVLNLAAIIIEMPCLLKSVSIHEAVTSIEVSSSYIKNIYSSLLDIFTELEICDNNIEFNRLFKDKLKDKIDPSVLQYLCGSSSYFIDKVSTKNLEHTIDLWNKTFDYYNLELLKHEYRERLQSTDEKSLEIAMHLRQEIIEKNNYLIKTYT